MNRNCTFHFKILSEKLKKKLASFEFFENMSLNLTCINIEASKHKHTQLT
jgi:hypothetical protein